MPGVLRYVAGDAVEGTGDGTEANPWALATAIARADAGDVLLLSDGDFTLDSAPDRALELHGACVDRTRIRGAALALTHPLTIDGAHFTPMSLTVATGATLTVNGALLVVSDGARVEAGGALVLHEAKVSGSTIDLDGALAATAAELRSIPTRVRTNGRATIEGSVLGGAGTLLIVEAGGVLELRSSVLSGDDDRDGTLLDARGSVTVERSRVRGGRDGFSGGGQLVLRESWLGPHLGAAVVLDDVGADQAELSDVYVRDTGTALILGVGDVLVIDRLAMTGGDTAVFSTADSAPASVAVHDLTTIGVSHALLLRTGAATIARVWATGSTTAVQLALTQDGELHAATLSDVTVIGDHDVALYLGNSAAGDTGMMQVDRVSLEDSGGTAIHIERDLILTLADVVVRGVRVNPPSPTNGCVDSTKICRGNGLLVRGGRLELSRFDFAGVTARDGGRSAGRCLGAAGPGGVRTGRPALQPDRRLARALRRRGVVRAAAGQGSALSGELGTPIALTVAVTAGGTSASLIGGGIRRGGSSNGGGTGHWVHGPWIGMWSTWPRRRKVLFMRLAFWIAFTPLLYFTASAPSVSPFRTRWVIRLCSGRIASSGAIRRPSSWARGLK